MVAVERILQYIHIQPQADVLAMPEGQAEASAAGSYGQLLRGRRNAALSSSQQVPAPAAAPGSSMSPVTVTGAKVVIAPNLPLIQIQDVYMRYSPGKPFALAGLSLSIALGERLGVVGRTGAGKSSLVAVLLRLVEIDSGERGHLFELNNHLSRCLGIGIPHSFNIACVC
jgi:ABC-type multidrug transport system fused ATPase/permease subunit